RGGGPAALVSAAVTWLTFLVLSERGEEGERRSRTVSAPPLAPEPEGSGLLVDQLVDLGVGRLGGRGDGLALEDVEKHVLQDLLLLDRGPARGDRREPGALHRVRRGFGRRLLLQRLQLLGVAGQHVLGGEDLLGL